MSWEWELLFKIHWELLPYHHLTHQQSDFLTYNDSFQQQKISSSINQSSLSHLHFTFFILCECQISRFFGVIYSWLNNKIYQYSTFQKMHYQTLYQEAKWKREQQLKLEHSKQTLIRQQSEMKKINHKSNIILAEKLYEKLTCFDDFEMVNIQTSIPILYSTEILNVIENIESAKERLEKGDFQNSRLRDEARFVYCLWKMIDEEEIQTREMKEIVYMLNDKPAYDLRKSLSEIYHDQEAVLEFVETWKVLLQDRKYYKAIEKRNQKISDRQIEKVINFDPVLKEKSFTNQFKEIQQCFLRRENYTSNQKSGKIDLLTMETINYSSKNKENAFLDSVTEKQMVDRLYNNDRYHLRQAKKKVEEERKVKAEMEECTFKPQINNRSISRNKRSRSVNGFQKSVNRMKVGIQKTRIEKQLRDYKPAGENYFKLREKKINPPKFLDRKKNEENTQFVIQFEVGRHKIKVKVKELDTPESIAKNLCKIYCLKTDYYEQICSIIRKQRESFCHQKMF